MDRECCCGCEHGEGHPHHSWKHDHGRRFFTRAEKIEKLKNYAEELRKELAGVEEHIKELTKE
jgi:hypothetical protein